MAYVARHLRKKSVSGAEPGLPPGPPNQQEGNLTLAEIENYFWPPEKDKENGTDDGRFPGSDMSRTLHASAATPNELSFVIPFFDANPRWEADKISFTKSRLDLLPKGVGEKHEEDATSGASQNQDAGGITASTAENGSDDNLAASTTTQASHPVAFFKQISSKRGNSIKAFQFEGWYKIDKIDFLEPHSAELVRMLEQKWTKTNNKTGGTFTTRRDAAGWQKSLGYKWAVIKWAKDEEVEKERGTPEIEKLPDSYSTNPKKSVNEMLAEMRMKDEKPEGTSSQAVETET